MTTFPTVWIEARGLYFHVVLKNRHASIDLARTANEWDALQYQTKVQAALDDRPPEVRTDA